MLHLIETPEAATIELADDEILLVNNADLREVANVKAWPVAADFERRLTTVLAERFGKRLRRAHPVDVARGHGFISSQQEGNAIFARLPVDAPVIVLVTTWQYSHHLAPSLAKHRGPVLLLANFDGTWPGLVGMLNLAGTLTGLGRPYSRLWSERFDDEKFYASLDQWLKTGRIDHDLSHLHRIASDHPVLATAEGRIGVEVARRSLRRKEIIGIFDAGCMGMLNGIFPMRSMVDIGMPIENLSQSDLLVEMQKIPQALREECLAWYEKRGMRFAFGSDEASELTREQVLEQCAMLIAMGRYVERFGLTAIGVQYQQGLAQCCAASDFAEGAIGSSDRFPIPAEDGSTVHAGKPIPCVNEVDVGTAIPQVLLFRLLDSLGLPAETTLHDVRWGSEFGGRFFWDYEISGAVPFEHIKGGIAGASGYRQAAMYFPRGGSTIAGQGKSGRIVWARAHYEGLDVHLHLGTGQATELPQAEFDRRRQATNPEWPLANVELDGVSRDQFMAGHESNHVTIAYVDDEKLAEVFRALVAQALTHGIKVTVAGSAIGYLQ